MVSIVQKKKKEQFKVKDGTKTLQNTCKMNMQIY